MGSFEQSREYLEDARKIAARAGNDPKGHITALLEILRK